MIPTFRPDAVVDPDFADFFSNVSRLGAMTGEDTSTWRGYLNALAKSRARFKAAWRDGYRSRPSDGADG